VCNYDLSNDDISVSSVVESVVLVVVGVSEGVVSQSVVSEGGCVGNWANSGDQLVSLDGVGGWDDLSGGGVGGGDNGLWGNNGRGNIGRGDVLRSDVGRDDSSVVSGVSGLLDGVSKVSSESLAGHNSRVVTELLLWHNVLDSGGGSDGQDGGENNKGLHVDD